MSAANGLPVLDEAEVVVVGAGPSGSACAARLAELGRDVLLIDQSRFPREKACGDALDPQALRQLAELGLDDLVPAMSPVMGVRSVFDYRRTKVREFGRGSGLPSPGRCCRRTSLDHAVLGAARERGARFMVARGDQPLTDGDRLTGIRVGTASEEGIIGAPWLVASDGATSGIRRRLALAPTAPVAAHAMRQYFRTERALEPLLDFYVPIEFRGFGLYGYGWVFPLEERLANIGVGYVAAGGTRPAPRLERMLADFVKDLTLRAPARLGDVEPLGEPLGSAVGIGFVKEHCQLGRIAFAGDAARTADPLTGKGIGNALEGGRLAAEALDRTITRGARHIDVGTALGRRFPRLGQNIGTLARLGELALNEETSLVTIDRRDDTAPLFRQLLVDIDPLDPAWASTPAGELMARLDPVAAAALKQVNARTLDLTRTTHPFFSEVIARETAAGNGPLPATLALIATRACGGEVTEALLSFSAALTANVNVLRPVLVHVVDRPRTDTARAQNAAIMLMSDFVGSRSWEVSDTLPLEMSHEIVRWQLGAIKGFVIGYEDRFDVTQSRKRHDLAMELVFGKLGELAFGLAVRLAGTPHREEAMRRMGREVARAHEAAVSIRDLLAGDPIAGRPPALEALLGFYSLPVVLALDDPKVRRLLLHRPEKENVPELLDAVRAAGGVDRALEECEQRAERAKAMLEAAGLERPELVAAVADLAVERAAASMVVTEDITVGAGP
jgi:menaquinone-9 beta-reductase